MLIRDLMNFPLLNLFWFVKNIIESKLVLVQINFENTQNILLLNILRRTTREPTFNVSEKMKNYVKFQYISAYESTIR